MISQDVSVLRAAEHANAGPAKVHGGKRLGM